MLNFSKRLASKCLKVTLVIATSSRKSGETQDSDKFNIEYISDGSNERVEPESIEAYFKRLNALMSKGLMNLIKNFQRSKYPPKVVVYDSTLTWALEVAQQFGLLGASFFTQSCAVCTLYYYMHQGILKIPPLEQSSIVIPGLPPLEIDDFPSFSLVTDANQTIPKLIAGQFSNIEQADWIYFNSFDSLETEAAKWIASNWPIKTIGPTIVEDNKDHGTCLFEMNSAEGCLKWLDERDIMSVVCISFGSAAVLGEEQMEELARDLIRSNCNFLWMVRASEESKLPVNFKSEVQEKGLVINWCPQLDVLAHKAVACFVTHCGWNSTLEALSSGIPLVAFPQMIDQMTNAKFVADVWQTGVRVQANDKGIVSIEEVEMRIREVTTCEKGQELRRNAEKWMELAQEAIAEGGSSQKSIDDFVLQISSV
ncbi:hypothetical protein ACH5RR_013155 [Cinchona calisaya]|uniref:Glycosyltransferase n=1 Tax=Cinchona calisaya TaxID=153742 RepID=A0ABD3A0K2_9GENT